MMLVADIERRVLTLFGDKAGVQIDEDMIHDWINDGQVDICRKAECLEAVIPYNLAVGTDSYPYPADFIKEQRVLVNGIKASRLTVSAIDILFPDREAIQAQGNPLYYFHHARNLVLYPVPSVAVTAGLVVWYIRTAAKIASSTQTPEIPEMYHEDLVRYCMIRAFEQDEEWSAAQQAKQEYDAHMLNTIYDSHTLQSESYPAVQLSPGDY